MSSPLSDPDSESAHDALRTSAALLAALTVVQAVLGAMLAGSDSGPRTVHQIVGFVTLAAAIGAVVTAIGWSRVSGNRGPMMHSIGLAVMAAVQVGLGESGVRTVHIVLGVLILLAALALVSIAYRARPGD